MQSDLFSCCICKSQFDKLHHLPKLIPTCSHTLCSSCLNDTLKKKQNTCPLDGIPFPHVSEETQIFGTNLLVLQLLDERLKEMYGSCNKHNLAKDFVCIGDQLQICQQCAVDHQGHALKHANEVKKEAQERKKKLEFSLEVFDDQKKEFESVLKNSQKSLRTAVREKFDERRAGMTKKWDEFMEHVTRDEKELVSEIDTVIEAERYDLDWRLEQYNNLQSRIKAQISDLSTDNVTPKLLRVLDAAPISLNIRPELDRILKVAESIKAQSDRVLDTLNTSLKASVCLYDKEVVFSASFNRELNKNQHLDLKSIDYDEIDKLKSWLDLRITGSLLNIDSAKKRTSLPNIELLKNVNKVKISFSSDNFRIFSLEALKWLWRYLKLTSDISFSFSNKAFNYEEALNVFVCDVFWATELIETFSIYLLGYIYDKEFETFFNNSLTKMPFLKSLTIGLNGTQITGRAVQAFMTHLLPKLTHLIDFGLYLGEEQVANIDIKKFSKHIGQSLKTLTSLSLGFECSCITDKEIETLIKHALDPLTNLKSFGLHLSYTKITDQSIELLCRQDSNILKNVNEITLDLSKTNILDKSIAAFSNMIILNKNLMKKINLNLDRTKITDSSVGNLFASLENSAKTITHLTLGFEETQISDTSISYLATHVLPQMTTLEYFSLKLQNTPITDKSIQELSGGLRPIFKNLNHFWLNLWGITVSEDAVRMIVDLVDLSSMPNLQDFYVGFDDKKTKDAQRENEKGDTLTVKKKLESISDQIRLRSL